MPIYDRCCAKRASNEQCTRRRKEGSEYCGTHMKGTPHGIMDTNQTEVKASTQKIEVWAQDIQGIVYYIDKFENVYDTANNITERLFLDIWTNGSITPNDALESAAQIIIDLFTLLINNKDTNENNQLETKPRSISIEPYTNIAIEELQLSVRPYNCLKRAQINTIGDLLDYSPEKLLELKNFGRKSADEVFATLKNKLGIVLK